METDRAHCIKLDKSTHVYPYRYINCDIDTVMTRNPFNRTHNTERDNY